MNITTESISGGRTKLRFGARAMIIREHKLPRQLYRLLPVPYSAAQPADWERFCVHAVALGVMK